MGKHLGASHLYFEHQNIVYYLCLVYTVKSFGSEIHDWCLIKNYRKITLWCVCLNHENVLIKTEFFKYSTNHIVIKAKKFENVMFPFFCGFTFHNSLAYYLDII